MKSLLEAEGFVLLDDQKAKLVDDIKRIIIELVHYGNLDEMDKNFPGTWQINYTKNINT